MDIGKSRLKLGLLTLLLAAGLVGCATGTGINSSSGGHGCGPYHGFTENPFQQFMRWTPDGNRVVFFYGTTLHVTDVGGSQMHELIDADPRLAVGWSSFPKGFYFDVLPNGSEIVYTSCEYRRAGPDLRPEQATYQYEIASINLDGTGQRRITKNPVFDHFPVPSPDGSRIAFHKGYNWEAALYTIGADGLHIRRVVTLSLLTVDLGKV